MASAGGDASSGTVQILHPGDVAVATRGHRMETLLGSCIAIVLTDPRRTIGAMCHIVHAGEGNSSAHAGPALRSMSELLTRRGIQARLCDAYVYGGGNMFPDLIRHAHVGQRNADWVFEALEYLGTTVLAHDVGGQVYRRVAWTVGSAAPLVHATPI